MIVGGINGGDDIVNDCWIHDLTTMKWKKVINFVLYMCITYCMFAWFWSSATIP